MYVNGEIKGKSWKKNPVVQYPSKPVDPIYEFSLFFFFLSMEKEFKSTQEIWLLINLFLIECGGVMCSRRLTLS